VNDASLLCGIVHRELKLMQMQNANWDYFIVRSKAINYIAFSFINYPTHSISVTSVWWIGQIRKWPRICCSRQRSFADCLSALAWCLLLE